MLGSAKLITLDVWHALTPFSRLERFWFLLWLSGPFILLLERTPADIWIVTLDIAFLFKVGREKNFVWFSNLWVKACFLFWLVAMVSASFSSVPAYSLGEAFVWFRFPLFAMATVFWLARDPRLLKGMVLSCGLAMLLMCAILFIEVAVEGQKNGRLHWPFGDAVSGNYLAKVCLPAFVAIVSVYLSGSPKTAFFALIMLLIVFAASVLSGERINSLIILCSIVMVVFSVKVNFMRTLVLCCCLPVLLYSTIISQPFLVDKVRTTIKYDLTASSNSEYFRVFNAAATVGLTNPSIGIGPAAYRVVCEKVIEKSPSMRCDNHPHNFYLQLFVETGVLGLIFGIFMMITITLAAFHGRRSHPCSILSNTLYIVPFAFFFPLQTSADFFGQWNNVFMWSSVALALSVSNQFIYPQASGER